MKEKSQNENLKPRKYTTGEIKSKNMKEFPKKFMEIVNSIFNVNLTSHFP